MNKSLIITILLIFTAAVVAVADDMDRFPPPGPDRRIPWVQERQGDRWPHGAGEQQWKPCLELEREALSGTTKMLVPIVDKARCKALLIKHWAASGEICRVLGHRWGFEVYEWGNDAGFNRCARPKKSTRECSICGKTETKEEVWR